ncbi:uncharacterized protein MELLADRAFT_79235 [Melampsora larici-populina 98AG31]|uniref:Secreted protein n=1 Tax=Melampsora larici-populina (strain 98AG31 / pathotype 3-4-7) TaxID=747676 RepID=F4S4K8_MELLP|nr:uncharacterized protein MELLADRAFT_79235 [Melampsora larici-populina 98AG31]EGG00432.1 secreted protein [Melampsora larici-populina 98AG31]
MKTSTIFLSTLVIFVGLLSNALAVKWSSNFAQEDIVTLTPLLKNMQTYLSAQNYGAAYDILGNKGTKKLVAFGDTTVIYTKQDFINAFASYQQFGKLKFNFDSAKLVSARSASSYQMTVNGAITVSFPVSIKLNANIIFAGADPVAGEVKSAIFTINFG